MDRKRLRLVGKRAIVTGAAMGLGEAIAVKFAEEGARVACVDVKGEPNEETVARIRKSEGEAYAMVGDVGVATDAERMVMEANDILGGIDILVNNAGVVPSRETVINTSEEDWDETIRVNVKGVFLMSKSVLPIMVEHGGGAIVNMSSIAGLVGLPVRPAYCASKGAVAILTRQMALDFGRDNIRVNAINPSFVITDINRELFEAMKAESRPWEEALDQHSIRRLGEPEDVAYAAVYLASDEARWVTGVLLPVDGGYTAR